MGLLSFALLSVGGLVALQLMFSFHFAGSIVKYTSPPYSFADIPNLTGKVAIVTGTNTGQIFVWSRTKCFIQVYWRYWICHCPWACPQGCHRHCHCPEPGQVWRRLGEVEIWVRIWPFWHSFHDSWPRLIWKCSRVCQQIHIHWFAEIVLELG